MKACSKCATEYQLSAYYVDKTKRDGRHSLCKSCHRDNTAKRRLDPAAHQKMLDQSRAYRQANPERFKDGVRDATLRGKYGIGIAGYDELFAKQGGLCAICGSDSPKISGRWRLHIDHCHDTGKIRGLLCQPCNTSIGKMGDSPERLRRAAEYVEAGGAPSSS